MFNINILQNSKMRNLQVITYLPSNLFRPTCDFQTIAKQTEAIRIHPPSK